MKRILAVVLSLCLLLCFPVAVSAEEDLISHYTGDDKAYLNYLYDFFYEKYGNNSDSALYYAGLEMAKLLNEYNNDMASHPYLRGAFSKETGEITIVGFKFAGFRDEEISDIVNYYNPAYTFYYKPISNIPNALVIPDEYNGHPITGIANNAFNAENGNCPGFRSVVIGDNVRSIGRSVFWYQTGLRSVTFGKNVQVIGEHAFDNCGSFGTFEVTNWGENLTTIEEGAFAYIDPWRYYDAWTFPPFPDTLKTIGKLAFEGSNLPETITIPQSVDTISCTAFHDTPVKNIIILNNTISIQDMSRLYYTIDTYDPYGFFEYSSWKDSCLYCYAGSTAEAFAKESCDPYQLIDGDSLLWDGEAVEGNVLHLDRGMTEAQLRAHLSIDGDSSEIQIEGLKDGKVVNGTTVTLFHKIAQAPGKVYTVEKEPEIVSVSVETLPKTNYFYKETFDPDGLSLRVTYDDGTEKSVTDGYTLTGTDLKLGTNTITATYENVSTTFPVTVRYAWWQHLIRIFLLGFLWY